MEYKGFEIRQSHGHGKCVAGMKRTATIQIQQPIKGGNGSYYLRGQVSFKVDEPGAREKAIEKAKAKINNGEITRITI